jgi:3-phosphoshikimate 1-carboxyvinyltransferase
LGCGVQVQGSTVTITGLGGRTWPTEAIAFFMGNAGTAMRPLTAALAVQGGDFTLKGVPRMHERPIGDLVDALRELGCAIDYLGNEGFPPLHIGQPALKLDKPIPVRGDVSSQFLTALLMALPLAAQDRAITIEVVGELISKPYIEITLNLLARFGIAVERQGWARFVIPAGSRYQSPGSIHVEADASSASYFIALGAIAQGEGIRIQGVGANSIQGDIRFMDAAAQMGAHITSGPPKAASLVPPSKKVRTGSPSTHSSQASGNAPASTPTTTTAWPCAFRWPPSTQTKCRCASKTPNAWPRPFPITSRPCSRWRTRRPPISR